jgi:predicted nucleic acid-binding protein
VRTYDVLIAATAAAHELPAYTCNPDAFTAMDGVEVVAVPNPDHPVA